MCVHICICAKVGKRADVTDLFSYQRRHWLSLRVSHVSKSWYYTGILCTHTYVVVLRISLQHAEARARVWLCVRVIYVRRQSECESLCVTAVPYFFQRDYQNGGCCITRVMCRQISAAGIVIVSGKHVKRERYCYAKLTATWATRKASTAVRKWKAGFSNGRITSKVINADGSCCQMASCRITGSFLRVIRFL